MASLLTPPHIYTPTILPSQSIPPAQMEGSLLSLTEKNKAIHCCFTPGTAKPQPHHSWLLTLPSLQVCVTHRCVNVCSQSIDRDSRVTDRPVKASGTRQEGNSYILCLGPKTAAAQRCIDLGSRAATKESHHHIQMAAMPSYGDITPPESRPKCIKKRLRRPTIEDWVFSKRRL
ncbi:hypothetical protein FQN60_010737, partial [Etheostoma spectabile]